MMARVQYIFYGGSFRKSLSLCMVSIQERAMIVRVRYIVHNFHFDTNFLLVANTNDGRFPFHLTIWQDRGFREHLVI